MNPGGRGIQLGPSQFQSPPTSQTSSTSPHPSTSHPLASQLSAVPAGFDGASPLPSAAATAPTEGGAQLAANTTFHQGASPTRLPLHEPIFRSGPATQFSGQRNTPQMNAPGLATNPPTQLSNKAEQELGSRTIQPSGPLPPMQTSLMQVPAQQQPRPLGVRAAAPPRGSALAPPRGPALAQSAGVYSATTSFPQALTSPMTASSTCTAPTPQLQTPPLQAQGAPPTSSHNAALSTGAIPQFVSSSTVSSLPSRPRQTVAPPGTAPPVSVTSTASASARSSHVARGQLSAGQAAQPPAPAMYSPLTVGMSNIPAQTAGTLAQQPSVAPPTSPQGIAPQFQQMSIQPPGPGQFQQFQPYQNVPPSQVPPVGAQQATPAAVQQSSSRINSEEIPSPVKALHDGKQVVVFHTRNVQLPPSCTSRVIAYDEGNCNPKFMRSSMYNLPCSSDLLRQSAVPFAAILKPLACLDTSEEAVPLVDMGSDGPIRCSRCGAYINGFMTFVNGGRQFCCNICGHTNDVPPYYFCPLTGTGLRHDANTRHELCKGTVDFVATSLYMLRAPQPLSVVLMCDVSRQSVAAGVVRSFVTAVRSALSQLPEHCPMRFGFITFDTAVHFYNLNKSLQKPQMLVVPDLENVFLPVEPEGNLLVGYHESKGNIEEMLSLIERMFTQTTNTSAALGTALQASLRVLEKTGGKVVAVQSSLPTVGEGKLTNRMNVKIVGTDKERSLYKPTTTWFNKLGDDYVKAKIGVDLFLLSSSFMDVATLGNLPKMTGGSTYFYSAFSGLSKIEKVNMLSMEHHGTNTFGTVYQGIIVDNTKCCWL